MIVPDFLSGMIIFPSEAGEKYSLGRIFSF